MDYAWRFLGEYWAVLAEMAPYLLLGFAVAGLLSVLIRPEMVERHLGGGRLLSVVKAAAFGVPLPLCSCGVIPVASSLRKHGAGRGATTAFLISTPQTGIDSLLVTFSLLGGVFAIFRAAAALVSGVFGGALVEWLDREPARPPERSGGLAPCDPARTDVCGPTAPPVCTDACCSQVGRTGELRRAMAYGFVDLPRDIALHLLIGLALAALISVLIPEDFFSERVSPGLGQMLVMLALGIPVYVCATASVPIAAALILHAGVSPGAALVFLMTGPATNAATLLTLHHTMGRRTAGLYLVSVAVSALASGLLLDAFFTGAGLQARAGTAWEVPAWVQTISAVVLLAVLGFAILSRKPRAV